jgi:hypothetical protein
MFLKNNCKSHAAKGREKGSLQRLRCSQTSTPAMPPSMLCCTRCFSLPHFRGWTLSVSLRPCLVAFEPAGSISRTTCFHLQTCHFKFVSVFVGPRSACFGRNLLFGFICCPCEKPFASCVPVHNASHCVQIFSRTRKQSVHHLPFVRRPRLPDLLLCLRFVPSWATFVLQVVHSFGLSVLIGYRMQQVDRYVLVLTRSLRFLSET